MAPGVVRVVDVAGAGGGDEDSDDERLQEGEEEEGEDDADDAGEAAAPARLRLALGRARGGCKACGSTDHAAGFVGSVYVDCPAKPCYLCKRPGHTTASCPYRPDAQAAAPLRGGTGAARHGVARAVLLRELGAGARRPPAEHPVAPRWRVAAAAMRLHPVRVTALDWSPAREGLAISGDKHGAIALWDTAAARDVTVIERGAVHRWFVTTVRHLPAAVEGGSHFYSASYDGTVCRTDAETHGVQLLLQLNAAAQPADGDDPNWRMASACEPSAERRCVYAGDDAGRLHVLDPRADGAAAGAAASSHQVGKKGSRIASLQVHPRCGDLLVSCGTDWFVRVWDARRLPPALAPGAVAASAGEALAALKHPRVVNSAFFSPRTGGKLLTTCQDNRLRLWDAFPARLEAEPDREIIHSHEFNRYLSTFRAVWDPKDVLEDTVVCGRYISEDYGGVALHPIDVLRPSSGRLLAAAADRNVDKISAVVAPHPTRDWLLAAASGSVYLWEPDDEAEEEGAEGEEEALRGAAGAGAARAGWAPRMLRLGDADDDDDEGGGGAGKKRARGKAAGAVQGKSPKQHEQAKARAKQPRAASASQVAAPQPAQPQPAPSLQPQPAALPPQPPPQPPPQLQQPQAAPAPSPPLAGGGAAPLAAGAASGAAGVSRAAASMRASILSIAGGRGGGGKPAR